MRTDLEIIREFLMLYCGVDHGPHGGPVQPEHFLRQDLGLDSLDLTELVMAVEEEFGVDIIDDVASNLTTVQSLLDCCAQP